MPAASFQPVSSSAYIGLMSRRLAARRWWLFSLPVATILIGLIVDWRIAVIGLMMLFIVYPMVVTLVMLNYALSPEVIARSRCNYATIRGDKIILQEHISPLCTPRRIPRHLQSVRPLIFKIKSVRTDSERLIFETGTGISDIVIIPQNAFSRDNLTTILNSFAPVYE